MVRNIKRLTDRNGILFYTEASQEFDCIHPFSSFKLKAYYTKKSILAGNLHEMFPVGNNLSGIHIMFYGLRLAFKDLKG